MNGRTHRYDGLHRLEEADAAGDHAYGLLRFEYDAAGNLLEKGPAADATTPAAGRLRLSYDRHGGGPVNVASVERHDGTAWVSGAASYSQNPSGAVTDFTKLGASTTLFRDADERVQAVVASGPAYNHYYDIAGQRTSKVRSSWGVILEARHYVDPGFEVDPIAETHEVHLFVGARRVATSKRPGLGLAATATADAVEYYHPDHVGSNTLITNAAGEVVQETVTTPFGELHAIVDGAGSAVSPQDSTTRYLFTDQEHDAETGLHYFGARFQDPWIGRFLSQDPELIGASAGVTFRRILGDGQNQNPYAYALNRPTVMSDPTGRAPILVPLATGVIGSIASGGGNLVGQIIGNRLAGRPALSIDWGDVGVSMGVGFLAGAAAPFVATTLPGAMGLSAAANVTETGVNAARSGEAPTPEEVAVSAATGAIGGAIGGAISRTGGRSLVFDESGRWMDGMVARDLNETAQLSSVVAPSNQLRTLLGALVEDAPVDPTSNESGEADSDIGGLGEQGDPRIGESTPSPGAGAQRVGGKDSNASGGSATVEVNCSSTCNPAWF